MMQYALVEFSYNKTVAVLPTNWYSADQTFCWWPPTKNNDVLKKIVQRRIIPDVETWRTYDIRILKEFDTYEKARKKLEKSTLTSDLETTDEEAPPKRSYHPPARYVVSDSMPPPPPAFPMELPGPSSTTTARSTTAAMSTATAISNTPSSAISNRPESHVLRTTAPVPSTDRHYMTLLEEIKAQVKQNSLLLQVLVKRRDFNTTDLDIGNFNFPLTTRADVDSLEGLLVDKATEKGLVNHLCTIGGISSDDTVRRIMVTVFKDQLACLFNWKGRGGKHAFCALTLCRAIKAACKKTGISEVDVERIIKSWLKYSADRSGGRKRRAEKKTAQAENLHASSDED